MRIYVTTANIEISYHMIMDLKERVARPSSSFSPSSFLLKSDLHFAAKVRKRFCFRRQKATERERERAMENAFFCSFALFRSFVSRSAAVTRPVSRYDKVVREEYGDFDDLCEVYGTVARAIVASHVYSKIIPSMKKPRNREDLRNTPHLILRAWTNYDRSEGKCHQSHSLAAIKISCYFFILSVYMYI